MSTSFKQRKTPGVYITEFDAFPKSVVGVQTAVPAFIGYTEKATVSGKPVYFKPIPISSLADYQAIFGAGFVPNYNIREVFGSPPSPPPVDSYDFVVLACESLCSPPEDDDAYYKLWQTPGNESSFNLYNSLRLFYANGGGNCYIVSVGDYTDQGDKPGGVPIDPAKLERGLKATADQTGPTMLVIPDSVLLSTSAQFYSIAKQMLKQCGDTQDRVAILDVYDTETLDQEKPDFNIELEKVKTKFYEGVGDAFLNFGMAYFPFLNSSVVQPSEILYTNFDIGIRGDAEKTKTLSTLQNNILTVEAQRRYGTDPVQYGLVSSYISDIDPNRTDPADKTAVTKLNQNLVNALPILGQIENLIASKIDLLPPSGAMAGVFTFIDQTRGVWNAPANTTLASVVSPTLKLNSEQQGELNKPLNGKAIDVIRQFPGRGSVVWGARTLDGNSNDWRYIQVRRTLIYVEQSIKLALDQFVFAANDGKTWVGAVSMVSNFLQGLWSQGGLMGSTATEAFTVECGLGSTMTPLDVLEGYMIVQVTLQMIHPAEFIELTFKQKMAGQA